MYLVIHPELADIPFAAQVKATASAPPTLQAILLEAIFLSGSVLGGTRMQVSAPWLTPSIQIFDTMWWAELVATRPNSATVLIAENIMIKM